MQPNHAGGYGFTMDDWKRLERFLVLGSEGGTYYIGERKLTAENATVAIRCIKEDGRRAVEMAQQINLANRAPKVDQQLFVLALALKYGDGDAKAAVMAAAPSMLRTGTHLLHFTAMLDGLSGWNRSKRRVIAQWFADKDADRLAYQVLKYQNRDGWTTRDVLRVAHPEPKTDAHKTVFDWICDRKGDTDALPSLLKAHNILTKAGGTKAAVLEAIATGLPREALPTEALADPEVWRALLPQTPIYAMLRNLGSLTEKGILASAAPETALVTAKLTDVDALRKARVHPFAILLATMIYRQGHGVRGSKTWVPVPAILGALEEAYDLAFETVSPTNKRILIAIDVSGSMDTCCIGTPISAAEAAVAVAVTVARLEPYAVVVQFDTAVRRILPITKRTGIAGLQTTAGGGTDLAAPVRWATGLHTEERQSFWSNPLAQLPAQRQEFDAIVVLTDNETWAGSQHPAQALDVYRRTVGQNAKLICCAMAATGTEIVDPTDGLSMGCAGLDANLPALVTDFIAY